MTKFYFILFFFATICGADLLSVVNIVPVSGSDRLYTTRLHPTPLRVYNDTIITVNSSDIDSAVWTILKERSGQYVKVAEVPISSYPYSEVVNNGKWMGGSTAKEILTLFQLDANYNVVNLTEFQFNPEVFHTVSLLSDNTIIYSDVYSASLRFLVFNPSNSTWHPGPSLTIPNCEPNQYPRTNHWIDDKFIICVNGSLWTAIYSRQADGSWLENPGFAFNTSFSLGMLTNIYFNGVDTIVYAFSEETFTGAKNRGTLVFYTSVNESWRSQVITSDDLGVTGASQLGFQSVATIDENNFIVGAPLDGAPATCCYTPRPLGSATLIQRQSGVWTPIARITLPGVIGNLGTVGVTSNHLIIAQTKYGEPLALPSLQFYQVSRCIYQPTRVTCVDQQVSSCEVDILNTNAYVIEDCAGIAVRPLLRKVKSGDFELTATLDFERPLSPVVSCNTTLTCSRPPTTIAPPVSSSVPSFAMPMTSTPVMSTSSPMTSDAPVSIPNNLTSNAATRLILSLMLFLLL